MFEVQKVVTYQVINKKSYTKVAQDLTDELVAQKIAAALNEQEIKNNEELEKKEATIEYLRKTKSESL